MTSTISRPKLRWGMVGGGQGAFIGDVHRLAAQLDNRYQLVAASLSSDPERARASAQMLGVARTYDHYLHMAECEAARDDGIDVVSIVTPNHLHVPIAAAFLQQGIHVICDKPLSISLEEAQQLQQVASEGQAQFLLTHNYTAYPMVRQARQMVTEGQLGRIRLVQVEYVQDWLATALEQTGNKQASWRSDPSQAGLGGCIGDIGTHAYHLASFVMGCRASSLLADLTSFVDGRALDDNAHILLRFANGAKGGLWASQVAPGNENRLTLRIYGDKGGIEWHQENPNHLDYSPLNQATQRLTRAGHQTGQDANAVSRIPAGHPEGYLEAFANLYREFADQLQMGETSKLPGLEDGLDGMRFIEAAVQSAKQGSVWLNL